jgi:hypothetical protein
MNAVRLAAPAASIASGFPLALLLAASVTALVALTLIVVTLRRRSRLNALTGWFSAAGAVAIVASALLIGGALAPSPIAVADPLPSTPVINTPRGASGPYTGVQVDGPQLATLGYDGP